MVFLLLFFLNFRGENVKRIVVKSIKLVEIWSFGKKLYILPDFSFLITDGKNKYSVPFDLIGEEVDIRLTKTMVEVFFHGSRVASHKRVLRPLRDPIVQPEHMPIEHRKYLTYNADEFIRWGQKRRA